MPEKNRFRAILLPFAIPVLLTLLLFVVLSTAAAKPKKLDPQNPAEPPVEQQPTAGEPAVEANGTPSLTVQIISARYAILDNTDPEGLSSDPPRVFVVEAAVANNSGVVAEDVTVALDYNEDPGTGWVLQGNEDPLRSVDSLAPGETYYAYYFASYPTTPGLTHVYTVTATANGFDPFSTSENYFGPPAGGGTVETKTYLSTGNSGVVQVQTEVIVGVAYTIIVDYKLGMNPVNITFSPAGNNDFEPSTTRLLTASVRFHDEANTQETVVNDQLYFPSIPSLPDGQSPAMAETTYVLLPLTPANTRLCAYAGVGTATNDKYDTHFCNADKSTVIPIEGTLSFTLTKAVDSLIVEQGKSLNYTLRYTNTGSLPLNYVWLWDDIDPLVGRIVNSTTTPAPDPGQSSDTRVAWALGDVPPAGEPGSSGILTVTVLIDGNGVDLPDGQLVENSGYFGIYPGSLPLEPAISQTVISQVDAPVVTISKSDGLEVVGNGEPVLFTITVTNHGPIPAQNLVITDILPAGANYSGGASGSPDFDGDRTLTWPEGSLPDLAAGGGTISLTVPVTTDFDLPSFTVLTNTAEVTYENSAGYRFQPVQAGDQTTLYRNAGFVEGYAFIDADGDGQFDLSESGLPNVPFTLTVALDPLATSDSEGFFSFRVEEEGWQSLEGGLPDGYFRTTPAVIPVLNEFDQTKRVDFGYAPAEGAQFGTITGLVFEDANHNGQFDGGEAGIPGVDISSTAAASSPVQSGNQGQYTLRFDSSGPVAIVESNLPAYVSTTPDSVNADVVIGTSGSSPVNFGDFLGIKVGGKVFEDLDVNGADDGEPGLSGATVSAAGESTVTLADGLYTLFVPVDSADPIQVIEGDPAGYFSTNAVPGFGMSKIDANTLQIDNPVSGTEYNGGSFGDVIASGVITISGQVWNDNGQGGGTMANGQKEGGEPGLPGAVVSLSSGMTQTTGLAGTFILYAPAGLAITVAESNPNGFVSTNAIPGTNATKVDADTVVVEPLIPGSTSANNYFGDTVLSGVVTISGMVWEDSGLGGGTAADGQRNGTEPPLAGARLALSSGMEQFTGPDGEFVLYGPAGMPLTLLEQNPPDYISSAAVAGNNAFPSGPDMLSIQPLAAGAASTGNAFGDLLPAGLSLTKQADPEPVIAGEILTYTLDYVNNGPSYAQDVTISDTLPAEVTFGGVVNQPAGWSGPAIDGQNLSWSAASLAADADGSFIYTVTVKPDTTSGTVISNQGLIRSNMPDLNQADNGDQFYSTVSSLADLGVAKIASPEPVVAGQYITYTITVVNHGPSAATGVVVTDVLPAGVTFVSAIPGAGSYNEANGLWTVGTLAVGQQAQLLLKGAVSPASTGTLTNTATAASEQVDPFPENNEASTQTQIDVVADLAIGKSANAESAAAGTPLTYTLVLTNYGTSAATNVQVFDQLPDGLTFQSSSPSQGTYNENTHIWSVGSLVVDGRATLTLYVMVDANASGNIHNEASVSADGSDPVAANDIDSADTGITRQADLAISKSDSPDPVAAGSEITYTISYTNNGPSDALNVTITDLLDDDVTFLEILGSDPDIWIFSQGGNELTWQSAQLPAGDSGTISYRVSVLPGAIAEVSNDVAITSDSVDLNGDNNTYQATTTIGDPSTATIYGFVFEDLNGNGQLDAAETGITGVLVTLDDGATTHTDANGLYFFLTQTAGIHKVVETDPAGYLSTTPNEIQVPVELGHSHRADFGDVQESDTEFASIFGTVFDDTNGDGFRDLGETGLAGVAVQLDGIQTVNTDIYGRYTFSTTVAGDHTLVESDPIGFFSTTPNEVQLSAELGQSYQADFGDARSSSNFASIHGTVFDDQDGDGERDAGEPGIPGVTVSLVGGTSVDTDQFGRYNFLIASAGYYTLEESDLDGYFSTTPNQVRLEISLGFDYEVDFGDATDDANFASIHGTVFEDLDSDASWDPQEVGLKGVTLTLTGGQETSTDLFGRYTFKVEAAGPYTVEEIDPPYYFSTTPNTVTVEVSLGAGYNVNFGDVPAQIASCLPDQYEEDDLYSDANQLLPDQEQSHDFCDDSSDWYRLSVKTGRLYTITTSSWAQRADTFVAIYSSDGQHVILGNDDSATTDDFSSELVWQPPSSGDYYLLITNRSGLTGFHTQYEVLLEEEQLYLLYFPLMGVDFNTPLASDLKTPHQSSISSNLDNDTQAFDGLGPAGLILHSCPDTYELDDSWISAAPIVPDVPQQHSFDSDPVVWAADKDFVAFDLLVNQVVTFTVTSNTGTSALLELYDANGVALGISGVNQLVYDPGLKGGHYYLSATPVSAVFGCSDVAGYTLQATYKPIYRLLLPFIAMAPPNP